MKSKSTKTTSENLEARFDAGKEVTDFFDTGRAFVWGGARRGAGRKSSGKVRKQVMLSAVVARKIGRIAARQKQSFSATVEAACLTLR
jgi:hypothetical protein